MPPAARHTKKILKYNKDSITDFVVENDCRNSAIPNQPGQNQQDHRTAQQRNKGSFYSGFQVSHCFLLLHNNTPLTSFGWYILLMQGGINSHSTKQQKNGVNLTPFCSLLFLFGFFAFFRLLSGLSLSAFVGLDRPFLDLNTDTILTGLKRDSLFRNLHDLTGHTPDGDDLITQSDVAAHFLRGFLSLIFRPDHDKIHDRKHGDQHDNRIHRFVRHFISSDVVLICIILPIFWKCKENYILVSKTAAYCLRKSSKFPASKTSRIRCKSVL